MPILKQSTQWPKKSSKKPKFARKQWLLVAFGLALIIAGLELTNVTHFFHSAKVTTTTISSSTPASTTPSKSTASAAPTTSSSSDKSTTPTTTGSSTTAATTGNPPLSPTGDFVSNHHPGGSAPTSEASTCNTSPGAVCHIEFTQGSTIKKLDAQTANSQGGVIWYWNTTSAGLTSGTWKITAVASLHGQTRSADDAQSLEIE